MSKKRKYRIIAGVAISIIILYAGFSLLFSPRGIDALPWIGGLVVVLFICFPTAIYFLILSFLKKSETESGGVHREVSPYITISISIVLFFVAYVITAPPGDPLQDLKNWLYLGAGILFVTGLVAQLKRIFKK